MGVAQDFRNTFVMVCQAGFGQSYVGKQRRFLHG
jgi:hypothetical protein